MKLPFKENYFEESKERYDLLRNNLKNESDLNGKQIRDILIKEISLTKLKFTQEKNVRGINENPFDLIVGEEEKLELYGFEIKGDTDTFNRLPNQLRAYFFTFEGIYLVLHKKEKPEWLPHQVGIIRVFENGEIFKEHISYIEDPFNISTDYEWDSLFKSNDLGINSKKIRDVLKLLGEIRKNILFNRFFAVTEGYNTHRFSKFYPLTEKQKTLLIGFDIPYHYSLLLKDTSALEKKFDLLKRLCSIGQKGLKEYEGEDDEKDDWIDDDEE